MPNPELMFADCCLKTFIRESFNLFKGEILSNFIVLGNWTDQGIRKVKEAPQRIKTTHDVIQKAEGKMQLYYTMGEYDFVMLVEAVKDEDMVAILLCLGSMGNIRTKTLKSWEEAEGTKILNAPHAKTP